MAEVETSFLTSPLEIDPIENSVFSNRAFCLITTQITTKTRRVATQITAQFTCQLVLGSNHKHVIPLATAQLL